MSKLNTPRSALLIAIAVIAVLGSAAAATVGSPGTGRAGRVSKRAGIAVFRHHRKLTRLATARLNPPPGAILAAVAGNTEVYALRRADGNDCVIHLSTNDSGGSACGTAVRAEEEGIVAISGSGRNASGAVAHLRITALVPNGVTSLKVTDRDGASYAIGVTDNVAEHEDEALSSVSYVLPSGGAHTTNVAAMVDQIPSQPGVPGSSR